MRRSSSRVLVAAEHLRGGRQERVVAVDVASMSRVLMLERPTIDAVSNGRCVATVPAAWLVLQLFVVLSVACWFRLFF